MDNISKGGLFFMQMHTLLTRQQAGLWAASLAIGLCLSLLCSWSCTQLHTGAALCADTLRLHVRADADTLLAQTLKLKVRDAVLESFQACPEQSQDATRRWAAQNLGRIQLQAQSVLAQAGAPGPVQVQLVNMYFDTTRYAAGSLPAGRYDAVRVQLGTGRSGKNWWCVLYPGLCRAACTTYAAPEENDLVCGEYIVRFKLVEWWHSHTQSREDIPLTPAVLPG